LEFLLYCLAAIFGIKIGGMAKLIQPRSRPTPKHRFRTLRVLRAERELTQTLIAERAGITQTRYWQIEHGEGAPVRKWERVAIARLLEVAPHQIAWPPMQPTRSQLNRAEALEKRRQLMAAASESV
jgi:DNA-binding XRE family transcriptional regulator